VKGVKTSRASSVWEGGGGSGRSAEVNSVVSWPKKTPPMTTISPADRYLMGDGIQPNLSPSSIPSYPLDRMRVVQGPRVGAVQCCAREDQGSAAMTLDSARRKMKGVELPDALLLGVFTSVDGSAKARERGFLCEIASHSWAEIRFAIINANSLRHRR